MKKKTCIVVASVLAFCAAGIIASQNDSAKGNDTLAANVEALSGMEGGSAKVWHCWSQFQKSDLSSTTECGNPCATKDGYIGIGLTSLCYGDD